METEPCFPADGTTGQGETYLLTHCDQACGIVRPGGTPEAQLHWKLFLSKPQQDYKVSLNSYIFFFILGCRFISLCSLQLSVCNSFGSKEAPKEPETFTWVIYDSAF